MPFGAVRHHGNLQWSSFSQRKGILNVATTIPHVATDAIRVYWQPGCTSCLRTKEFLAKRGIAFISRNVLADDGAMDELAVFGLRQVPIVTRDGAYADGQVLADVARLCGLAYGATQILPVPELHQRMDRILTATQTMLAVLPATQLATLLPNRPRSYADLGFHIFNIADAFLEHDAGIPLVFDAYNRVPPQGWGHRHLAAYGRETQRRVNLWFATPARKRDWQGAADVYYGRQTLHEFLERTTWHSGQHARQLQWVSGQLGLTVAEPLGADLWAGLPMPEQVWDPV
jgi:glutaredoxin